MCLWHTCPPLEDCYEAGNPVSQIESRVLCFLEKGRAEILYVKLRSLRG